MNDTQRQAMAREIHASYEAELLQPDELTHMIYAKATGVSARVAEKILLGEVAAGRMTRREAIGNRGMVWAYAARCTDPDDMQRNSTTGHHGDTKRESPPDRIWDQIDRDFYPSLDRTDDMPY